MRTVPPAALLLGCFCLFSCTRTETLNGNPDGLPWISVSAGRIVANVAGEPESRPFIPVGIGYCRDVIIKAQDEQVMEYCTAHHLNTVRLAFYTRFFNNNPAKPIDIDAHLASHCDPVIQAARTRGLHVILDDHAYMSSPIDEEKARQEQKSRSWDEAGVQEWIDRWVKVAERYKDDPTVLGYELCNEPHDIAPDLVRAWYTRCLRAIRQVDRRHIVIVGTAVWSHARALESTWGDAAETLDAPYNQVVFAFHDYPRDNEPWIVQQHITAFRDRHHVPVLCTEFGATWWNNDETTCRTFQAGMLAVFAKEDVGWMVWALKNLADNPRDPHPLPRVEGAPPPPKGKIYDSCAYSDLWAPVARIMATKLPGQQPASQASH